MKDTSRNAVIVSAARTPIGRFLGGLASLKATDLGAAAIRAALDRSGADPNDIEDVILGNVVSAEITYANNLDRIETIRSDGRIDGADPSIAALTGRIEVRFADQTLVTQAINGEACEMEFAYVLPSGESFTFTVHAVYLPRPRIEISGPQGVQATFDWQAARDTSDGRMCTATLINDIEEY